MTLGPSTDLCANGHQWVCTLADNRCMWCGVLESSLVSERRTKVNGKPYGTIAWWEHEAAWVGYHKRYPGIDQDAERIAERGGFGWGELTTYLGHEPTTHQP